MNRDIIRFSNIVGKKTKLSDDRIGPKHEVHQSAAS